MSVPLSNVRPNSSILNVFYCNVRSVKNKLLELHEILYALDFNIIVLTESWLSPLLSNGILDPKGLFNIYRKDRAHGYCDVCIFVSTQFQSYIIDIDIKLYGEEELVGCRVVCQGLDFFYL